MLAKKVLRPGVLVGLFLAPALMAADGKATVAGVLSAEQIVEKHVAARGGLQAWRAVQTLSLSGKMDAGEGDSVTRSVRYSGRPNTRPGKIEHASVSQANDPAQAGKQVQLPFTLQMKRPNQSRLQIEFAGKTAVQVYDGTNGWKLRPYLNRDEVEPFSAQESKSAAGKGDIDGPLVDCAAKGAKVTLETVEKIEGGDAYKLKVTAKDGNVQHVWIDAKTFLDVKIDGVPRRMDGRMHGVWVYQRDFRPVQGVMIPFVLETAVEGYPERHKVVIEKATVNPTLGDAVFLKPGA